MSNRVVINFDTKLFKKEVVLLAAHDYTDSCWVLVDGSDESVMTILIPKQKDVNLKTLKDEFYNYVLATIKNEQFI